MSDSHLLILLKMSQNCSFQSITFNENGDMEIKFFDAGGNWFHQTMFANGKFVNHS